MGEVCRNGSEVTEIEVVVGMVKVYCRTVAGGVAWQCSVDSDHRSGVGLDCVK